MTMARLARLLSASSESAGAEPGPACYGWGGTDPTVADADLILGYLNPDRFCDGRVPLDVSRARHAIEDQIARPRNVSAEDAALGILQVCVTNMVGAVRNITMERGYDPRDFSLVAFGGAGPVHAIFVAAELGIPEVLVLREPGLLSAKGMLLTNYRADVFRTIVESLADAECERLNALFLQMESEALAQLPSGAGEIRTRRLLELCYEGQQNVVPVEAPHFPLQVEHKAAIAAALDEKFKAIYGFLPQNRRAQILHVRVFVERLQDTKRLLERREHAIGSDAAPAPNTYRKMLFPNDGAVRPAVPVYDRDRLPCGTTLIGPLVIEESYSNTVVGPGHTACIDTHGNILISIR